MNEVERNNKTMKISFANFENLPEFKPGEHYTVIIDYWGELADDLAGFYRGKYVEDNVTKFVEKFYYVSH